MADIYEDKDKAVIVGICTPACPMDKTEQYLDELAFLIDTANGVAVKSFIQKLQYPDSRTFVGSGKLQEIKDYIKENDIEFVVFDDELSPAQLRNIEKELEAHILDRTSIILNIFAQRARTSHSKVQVELAQLQYMLPRLTKM